MTATFRRNLAILHQSQPEAARAVEAAEPPPYLTVEAARNGLPNLVAVTHGTSRSLHSRVDPAKEAERLAAVLSPETGLVVLFGLGAGHHLRSVLSRRRVRAVILCEPDPAFVTVALEISGVGELLGDTRVTLLSPCTEGAMTQVVGSTYAPLFHRQAAFLPLRGRTDLERDAFAAMQAAARRGVEQALADFATQRAFGRRWLHNILINLAALRRSVDPVPREAPCIVTAAGPSLERLFHEGTFDPDSTVVATDTSLPMLLQRGLQPHFVVTIDSQLASYHHFLRGVPEGSILVADVTASPTALRQARCVSLRIGGHPLGRYFSRQIGGLGSLYTSAGSVTHAALSFAHEHSGRSHIRLFGADFAYPRGEAYARDSYLHRHFRLQESRLGPAEHAFADFVYRRAERRPLDGAANDADETLHYVSALLDAYGRSLTSLADELGIHPIRATSAGTTAPPRRDGLGRRTNRGPASVPVFRELALSSARDLFARYLKDLTALTPPDPRQILDLEALSPVHAELWHTLAPLAAVRARCKEETGVPVEPPAVSLEEARQETIATIRGVLAAWR